MGGSWCPCGFTWRSPGFPPLMTRLNGLAVSQPPLHTALGSGLLFPRLLVLVELLGFCYALTPRFYQTALSYLS